ncbi:MAG: hypothetical protein ACI87W_002386 [Halieaceae bacterium]|jgi:hypothetical protein
MLARVYHPGCSPLRAGQLPAISVALSQAWQGQQILYEGSSLRAMNQLELAQGKHSPYAPFFFITGAKPSLGGESFLPFGARPACAAGPV